jgi:hypothetical protein
MAGVQARAYLNHRWRLGASLKVQNGHRHRVWEQKLPMPLILGTRSMSGFLSGGSDDNNAQNQ